MYNTSTDDIYRAALDVGVDSTALTIPLDRHEAMERSVSIKLAVWKATCITSTKMKVLVCYAWIKSGWNAELTRNRDHPV
jgi:hypothetical protein